MLTALTGYRALRTLCYVNWASHKKTEILSSQVHRQKVQKVIRGWLKKKNQGVTVYWEPLFHEIKRALKTGYKTMWMYWDMIMLDMGDFCYMHFTILKHLNKSKCVPWSNGPNGPLCLTQSQKYIEPKLWFMSAWKIYIHPMWQGGRGTCPGYHLLVVWNHPFQVASDSLVLTASYCLCHTSPRVFQISSHNNHLFIQQLLNITVCVNIFIALDYEIRVSLVIKNK